MKHKNIKLYISTMDWADVIARVPYGMEELCHYEVEVYPYEIMDGGMVDVTVTLPFPGHPANYHEAQAEFYDAVNFIDEIRG